MSKSQRFTTTFLNNLKPNPKAAKSTDYEVNLSAMKYSGLPTGVRCLVGKSGGKRFLLRYTSSVTGKKAFIGVGKPPETDLATLRKASKEYRQQIIEGAVPKLERDNKTTQKTMTLERFFDEVYLYQVGGYSNHWQVLSNTELAARAISLLSGGRHLLPSAVSLRTQRATFTALGSSLHKGIK